MLIATFVALSKNEFCNYPLITSFVLGGMKSLRLVLPRACGREGRVLCLCAECTQRCCAEEGAEPPALHSPEQHWGAEICQAVRCTQRRRASGCRETQTPSVHGDASTPAYPHHYILVSVPIPSSHEIRILPG